MIPVAIVSLEDEKDRTWMEKVYLCHEKLMWYLALKLTERVPDAEDVVNMACEKLIRQIETLRALEECALRQYIVLTVRSAAADFYRMRKRETGNAQMVGEDEWSRISSQEDLEEETIRMMDKEALGAAVGKLSERDARLLSYKYLDELPVKEIARLMNVDQESVRVLLRRARARLAARLKEEMFDD